MIENKKKAINEKNRENGENGNIKKGGGGEVALFLLIGACSWPVSFFAVGKVSIKVQSSLLLCFWLFEKKLT